MLEFKIAVCDDEQAQLDRVSRILDGIQSESDFKKKYKITLKLKHFLNGEDLLARLRKIKFDAFILDIQMEPMNGLELAQEIQRLFKGAAPIILLTAYQGFVFDGYKVRAMRYVLKNEMERGLREALPYLFNLTENSAEHYALFENGLLLPTKPDCIFYMESEKNYVRIYFHDSIGDRHEALTRGSLAYLAKEMTPYDFVFCHRSYLINLRKVQEIKRNEIILVDGTCLPLSRSARSEVIKAYSIFSGKGTALGDGNQWIG